MGHMPHGKTDESTFVKVEYGNGAKSSRTLLSALFTESPIYKGEYTDEKVNALGNSMVTEGIGGDQEATQQYYGELITFDYTDAPDITKVKSGGVNQPSSPYTPNLASPDADGNQPATPKELKEALEAKAVKASTQNAVNPLTTSTSISGAATVPASNLLFGQRPGSKPEDNYIKSLLAKWKIFTKR